MLKILTILFSVKTIAGVSLTHESKQVDQVSFKILVETISIVHFLDEKVNKRYSARARPDHWNNRQSPSPQPMQNDQNFNDRSQIQEDPLQDALGKSQQPKLNNTNQYFRKTF